MTGLGLIVETPRGGNAGHRFLTSRSNAGEKEVASAAASASQSAVGRAYISVSRQVIQRLQNGSVREGAERMILHGLDVDQLQPEQIEQVKIELTTLLLSLDSLIQSIEWPSDSQSTVIFREELRQWVDREVFRHLPRSRLTASSGVQDSVPPSRSQWKWLIIGTCTLASIIVLSLFLGRHGGKSEIGTNQKLSPPLIHNESRVRELASEWQCTPEEALSSLMRASNWDRRREADSLTLSAGMTDGEILEILNKVEASKGSDRFCVSPSIEGVVDFRRFVEESTSLSAEKMRHRRNWLYSTWMQFTVLKQAAEKVHDALIQVGTEDAFSRMLVSVAEVQTEVGLGDTFQKPVTPLLERQDLMIFRLLDDVRQKCAAAGFDQFGTEGRGGMAAAGELVTFVAELRVHHESVRNALRMSRARLTDSIRDKQGANNASAVFEAYKSFEEFLEQLLKNPNP